MKRKSFIIKSAGISMVTVVFLLLFVFAAAGEVFGQEREPGNASGAAPEVQKIGLIAAAVAFGFGALGAGIAIANVGSAAMGAIGERPEIAGQALIFIALAEGLVVFGFITALMILGKV